MRRSRFLSTMFALLVWAAALAGVAGAQVLPGLGSADPSQQLKTLAPPIGSETPMGAPWFGAQPPLVTITPELERQLIEERRERERRAARKRPVRRRVVRGR